ncbi:MAG: DUF1015 domain-containing protein [Solirubrobacterales bacterium]|nr:DUF1015 domain-containing protein [Solirubrobacterales bacterium]
MAEIEPLHALRYDPEKTNGLQDVVAPPYDVIDADERALLEARSPYNVVRIDLPRGNGDPYEHAADELAKWTADGIIVRESDPSLWLLEQAYTGPDGRERSRRGFFARVRVEDYGAGRIRPHERTHPGPKEDRLRLTRATRANLSPIFSLFDDREGAVAATLEPLSGQQTWAETVDNDGTQNRLWRIGDTSAIDQVKAALRATELLIADGHHRYETARVYADELGGEGEHRYVLMCLVALQDPGLTVFPTHRLIRGLRPAQHEALAAALRENFEIQELEDTSQLAPRPAADVTIGYIDSHVRRPFLLKLKDPAIADAALPDHAEPYRRLDTAVLEALILKRTLGMSDENIDHLEGLGYARDARQALDLVSASEYDAAFFMAPTPVERVKAVADAGESMPPKSTYFFPKVPTGLLFNPLA